MTLTKNTRALILGVNGQDGRLLAERLSHLGIKVFGVGKQAKFVGAILNSMSYIPFDLNNFNSLDSLLSKISPTDIFHFAAVHGNQETIKRLEVSHKGSMRNVTVEVTKKILDWQKINSQSKLFMALTSQMYDPAKTPIVSASSPTNPVNVYAELKLEAWEAMKESRSQHGITCYGLVMFNHASQYSKQEFLFQRLSRLISDAIRRDLPSIQLAFPDSRIDICHADDFIDAVIEILTSSTLSVDLILGSGTLTSLRDIIMRSFTYLNSTLDIIDLPTNFQPSKEMKSDIKMTTQMIGWRPQRDVSRLLASMVEFA